MTLNTLVLSLAPQQAGYRFSYLIALFVISLFFTPLTATLNLSFFPSFFPIVGVLQHKFVQVCRSQVNLELTKIKLTNIKLINSSLDFVSSFPLLLYFVSPLESRGWFWSLCNDLETIFLMMLSCHRPLQTLENSQTNHILLEIS